MTECKSKGELLLYISEVTFMLDDLTLYLNTHPDCKYAKEAYAKYKQERIDAMNEYEKKYGLLCRYDANGECGWSYANKPWPWERMCDK